MSENLSSQVDHQRLTSLINSMGDGVIAIDSQLKVVVYNGAALNILDINRSINDVPVYEVLTIIDNNDKKVDLKSLILSAKTPLLSRDYRVAYKDGSFSNLYLSIAPVHLGYGKKGDDGYVLLLRDITKEKSLEEERDEFISVVSHELRTPIAISEGNVSNAQLLAEKNGDINKIKEALKLAHDQIVFLSNMINDLSTLSRAERGKLAVEIESINVHDLLQDLLNLYKPEADSKGLDFQIHLDPHLHLLNSAALYVREILQNFITNAIKYTEKGQVVISATQISDGVEFSVSDTGIGISKSDQEKVFKKFFRSEDYRTRENNGTGLGLYVTMKLAGLIKAKISMSSELNKGSIFKIQIPNLNQ